jgi:hypothetical protein
MKSTIVRTRVQQVNPWGKLNATARLKVFIKSLTNISHLEDINNTRFGRWTPDKETFRVSSVYSCFRRWSFGLRYSVGRYLIFRIFYRLHFQGRFKLLRNVCNHLPIIWCHIFADHTLNLHRYENLKYQTAFYSIKKEVIPCLLDALNNDKC